MQKTIETNLGSDGIITITIHGDLLEDNMKSLETGLKESVKILTDFYNTKEKKTMVLIDMTDFTGKYALSALTAMVEFAKATKMYANKSAVFGGSFQENMAAETVISLAGRTKDVKVFTTKEEALAWLK